jgi:D-3-phosphoglycerate dehydrogenase
LTPQTRHIISADALKLMKPQAVLINTARGELVDEQALLAALRSNELAGAGLDVFECEHAPQMRGLAEQLLCLPTVVATPHSAASSRESLARANALAADCVVAVLEGRAVPPQCIVADGRLRQPC